MKASVYYVASNQSCASARIVDRMAEKLHFPMECVNLVASERRDGELAKADVVIFVAPTYGDQELQADMERFLVSTRITPEVRYVVCEIGNYYGYDDYRFGSGEIIDRLLAAKGATRLMNLASIDTLPRLDWQGIDQWIERVNRTLQAKT